MDIASLREFFMWCTIINAVLLLVAFLVNVIAGDLVYRVHSRLFPMSREAFNLAIYSSIGLLKLFILVFNFVPYLALVILG